MPFLSSLCLVVVYVRLGISHLVFALSLCSPCHPLSCLSCLVSASVALSCDLLDLSLFGLSPGLIFVLSCARLSSLLLLLACRVFSARLSSLLLLFSCRVFSAHPKSRLLPNTQSKAVQKPVGGMVTISVEGQSRSQSVSLVSLALVCLSVCLSVYLLVRLSILALALTLHSSEP